jgi:glycosyltransferase involved in cell wall biosynthesis
VRLSFVIPTRNQARFLRRAIDSCLAQGVRDAEVIVVDGLSTDGSQEVLRSYGERVRWSSEADRGQADAVNRGVARARGEVVAWLNSDDAYAGPGVLPEVLAAFDADPEVDVVLGRGAVVDAEGRPLRPYRNRAFRSIGELLASPTGPCQPAMFFRRRLFEEAGGLREDLHLALDYELALRLFERARKVRHLPTTLALTTFHPDAKSLRSMGPQIRELGRVKREHARRLGLGAAQRARIAAGQLPLWGYWLAVRLGLRRAGA